MIALFEAHHVLTKEEMESRFHIYLEKYSKQLNIEAGIIIEMARRSIFPAVSDYAAKLGRDAAALAAISADSKAQERCAKKVAELIAALDAETTKLETALAEARVIEDPFTQAKAFNENVKENMDAVREKADALERIVAKTAWPFPGYEDLLFRL